MEIKAILEKPYTDKQRIDFIVANNHAHGYDIRETENALEAWGYTADEIKKQYIHKKIADIDEQLTQIDARSARSIRAILAETATTEDREFLTNLETQAELLRDKRKELEKELNDA